MKLGADINMLNCEGSSPVRVAKMSNSLEVKREGREGGEGREGRERRVFEAQW